MGKKSKTPKTPKPGRGSASRKDAVTGITLEIDGLGKVTSDEVFSKDSALGAAVLSADTAYKDSLTSFEAEVELSNQFIVLTTHAKGTPPSSMSQEISRVVLQGDFVYSGSKLKSARIDYITQVSDGITSEHGTIEAFRSGIRIVDPDSINSWTSSLAAPGEMVASYDSSAGSGSGDKSSITSFAGGRFFYDGWQSNPFTPNLI